MWIKKTNNIKKDLNEETQKGPNPSSLRNFVPHENTKNIRQTDQTGCRKEPLHTRD